MHTPCGSRALPNPSLKPRLNSNLRHHMIALLRRLFGKNDVPSKPREKHVSPCSVTFDENGISTFWEGAPHETISWEAVLGVFVEIKHEGLLSVPHWYVSGKNAGIAFPSNALGHEALLDKFNSKFPGYRTGETYRMISEAMVADTGSFLIWKRDPG
jgi:hypothetical protein